VGGAVQTFKVNTEIELTLSCLINIETAVRRVGYQFQYIIY